jgi:hypothetical protein
VESRWRKGTTTFGPVGRVSWTAVVVLLPIFVLVFGGFAGILFVAGWCGIIAPMALRDLWKKDWVYTPGVSPRPAAPVVRAWDGTAVPSLSDYVASQAPKTAD